jgi:GNAT superfamily N-acetyltransferase
MPVAETVACWELIDTSDPLLGEVRKLYEATQAQAERIPWEWLQRSVARRAAWRPGDRCPHLLVAAARHADGKLGPAAGFAYGAHIPGYGGYLCYLGVAPASRRLGVATRLFEHFFRLLAVDAGTEGTGLPFVIWESRRPDPGAPPAALDLWSARLLLFDRVGGRWVEGVDFLSPDFEGDGPPVPLQLFVKPVDVPAEAFDADRLVEVVRGLQSNVYRMGDDSPLARRGLPSGARPRLRPATAAQL